MRTMHNTDEQYSCRQCERRFIHIVAPSQKEFACRTCKLTFKEVINPHEYSKSLLYQELLYFSNKYSRFDSKFGPRILVGFALARVVKLSKSFFVGARRRAVVNILGVKVSDTDWQNLGRHYSTVQQSREIENCFALADYLAVLLSELFQPRVFKWYLSYPIRFRTIYGRFLPNLASVPVLLGRLMRLKGL